MTVIVPELALCSPTHTIAQREHKTQFCIRFNLSRTQRHPLHPLTTHMCAEVLPTHKLITIVEKNLHSTYTTSFHSSHIFKLMSDNAYALRFHVTLLNRLMELFTLVPCSFGLYAVLLLCQGAIEEIPKRQLPPNYLVTIFEA